MWSGLLAEFVPRVLALVATVFAILFRRVIVRFDKAFERIDKLERATVTRAERDAELRRMHQETNSGSNASRTSSVNRAAGPAAAARVQGVAQAALLKAELALAASAPRPSV